LRPRRIALPLYPRQANIEPLIQNLLFFCGESNEQSFLQDEENILGEGANGRMRESGVLQNPEKKALLRDEA
jgi:hypothetical protein